MPKPLFLSDDDLFLPGITIGSSVQPLLPIPGTGWFPDLQWTSKVSENYQKAICYMVKSARYLCKKSASYFCRYLKKIHEINSVHFCHLAFTSFSLHTSHTFLGFGKKTSFLCHPIIAVLSNSTAMSDNLNI